MMRLDQLIGDDEKITRFKNIKSVINCTLFFELRVAYAKTKALISCTVN